MRKILTTVCSVLMVVAAVAQGYPPTTNFTSSDYNAHSRNFGIAIDSSGIVWVANFEGLMYYNNAEWQIIHTPGYSRVTVVYTAQNGDVWVGGYNYFGKVEIAQNGVPYLRQVSTIGKGQGEVQKIWEENGEIKFATSSSGNTEDGLQPDIGLDNGYSARIIDNRGIDLCSLSKGLVYSLNPETGLIADNVAQIAYRKGLLWGVGNESVFALQTPSPFTLFSKKEGLSGSVLSITEYKSKIYVGTLQGLFVLEDNLFKKIKGFNNACWCIIANGNGMICATSNGIVSLEGHRYSNTQAFSLINVGNDCFLAGCNDGVYLFDTNHNTSKKICPLEKVMRIQCDNDGTYWFQGLNGQIWYLPQSGVAKEYNIGDNEQGAVVIDGGKAVIVKAEDTEPFEYPFFTAYEQTNDKDYKGVTWLTDNAGKNLYRWINGAKETSFNDRLYPIKDWTVRTLFEQNELVWLGGDDGVCVIDLSIIDPVYEESPKIKIRTVEQGDSIVWGGFGTTPNNLGTFSPSQRSFKFAYSTANPHVIGQTLYRHRLNNSAWSNWEPDQEVTFLNLHYGKYTFEVQAQSPYGIQTDIAKTEFKILYPYYMRWYANMFYVLLGALLVYIFLRYRTQRLKNEKLKLEKTVEERTAVVVCQKNEIEQKSKSLEKALQDLSTAQSELIRQEKMATVGKLTQGLIDRILNPLNYINNFSKLSIGLVNDVSANIEDDKDKMDEENYEDTVDVLQMLKGNLQKVADHGLNTTRTLKAMEEMLKDRTGGMVDTDIKAILKQNEEVVSKYHESCIKQYGIQVSISLPETSMPMHGNPELLSKTFMSIINNGFYAVVKKAEKNKYTPEIKINATIDNGKYIIKFYDNGIGIESTIIDKVFDPFFTTKPTGEASGVGLYLSREIIQNHHGDISVVSEKNSFTEVKVEFEIES